jgi:hypothetical protein
MSPSAKYDPINTADTAYDTLVEQAAYDLRFVLVDETMTDEMKIGYVAAWCAVDTLTPSSWGIVERVTFGRRVVAQRKATTG